MQSQTDELEREKLQNIQHDGYIRSLEADINELVRYKRQLEVSKAKENQKCRKCDRIDGHSPGECDANKVVCRNCRKRGHLTKFCEFVCRTGGMEEFHPAKQCPALSATCELCRVDIFKKQKRAFTFSERLKLKLELVRILTNI